MSEAQTDKQIRLAQSRNANTVSAVLSLWRELTRTRQEKQQDFIQLRKRREARCAWDAWTRKNAGHVVREDVGNVDMSSVKAAEALAKCVSTTFDPR